MSHCPKPRILDCMTQNLESLHHIHLRYLLVGDQFSILVGGWLVAMVEIHALAQADAISLNNLCVNLAVILWACTANIWYLLSALFNVHILKFLSQASFVSQAQAKHILG